MDESRTTPDTLLPHLTPKERWNLGFCLLAWAFAICNVALIVGTSNVVLLSIDASADRFSSIPLATFFAGSSLVSAFGFLDTLFHNEGRKFTFFVGTAFSLTGTILGASSLLATSWMLLAAATACFGAANGVAFHLRFAAMQLVRPAWSSLAVAATVSGGALAAVGGPEVSHWVRGVWEDDEAPRYAHMGVFLLTGVYGVLGALCTAMIDFGDDVTSLPQDERQDREVQQHRIANPLTVYARLLSTRSFVVPLLLSSLSWAIMALPMSLARVVMHQVGYSPRQSLTTIELHFLAMYGTGLLVGALIRRIGYRNICWIGVVVNIASMTLHLLVDEEEESSMAMLVLWVAGLIALGVGWSFGFTGATVWLSNVNVWGISPSQVQSANDCFMFLISGAFTFSASFIFQAFGSGLNGWRTLNAGAISLLTLYTLILVGDQIWEKKREKASQLKNRKSELESYNNSVIDEVMDEIEDQHQSRGATEKLESQQQPRESLDEQELPLQDPRQLSEGYSNGGLSRSLADSFDDTCADDTSDDDSCEEDSLPPPPPPLSELRLLCVGDYDLRNKLNNTTFSTDEESRDTDSWPVDEVALRRFDKERQTA